MFVFLMTKVHTVIVKLSFRRNALFTLKDRHDMDWKLKRLVSGLSLLYCELEGREKMSVKTQTVAGSNSDTL
jgi:hypothetical protein